MKLLTSKDVVARGFFVIEVPRTDTSQSPDHHRVNGDNESHVFIQQCVFQDEPANLTNSFSHWKKKKHSATD